MRQLRIFESEGIHPRTDELDSRAGRANGVRPSSSTPMTTHVRNRDVLAAQGAETLAILERGTYDAPSGRTIDLHAALAASVAGAT